MDALCCQLTGNTKIPVEYNSELTGQRIRFKPGEVMHFSSLPSTREINVGAGFCAVSRALSAAKLLMGLHDYDAEKLNNLPPEGVAAVTGMTMDEFNDAISLWMAKRKQNDSLTFPQVLWLIGSQPNSTVAVNFTGFSQLPESFDRTTVVTQYVNTLALCFGVDVREFWAVSSGALGTAGESEIQHLKAKGKGAGEFISITERHINGELPEGVDFEYDTKDIDEDLVAANTAKAWIDAFLPLYTSKPGTSGPVAGPGAGPGGQALNNPTGANGPKLSPAFGSPSAQLKKEAMTGATGPTGSDQSGPPDKQNPNAPQKEEEPVITKKQLLRLLADKGVLPDYMVTDERTVIVDSDIHKEGHGDDFTEFVWKAGILTERRLPPITLVSPTVVDFSKIDVSIVTKSDDPIVAVEDVPVVKRNIVGKPIPDQEVERGVRITRAVIKSESKLWRSNPDLKDHALTVEEEDTYLDDKS
jgi:hypothetical protein